MRIVKIQDAVGQALCHDITKIVPGEFKGIAFKKGHIIKEEDIEASKNTIITAIKSSSDEPMGIINTHLSKVLVGTEDNDVRIEKFSKLTKEDIIKVSKKINLHTVLTLEKKGDEHGED